MRPLAIAVLLSILLSCSSRGGAADFAADSAADILGETPAPPDINLPDLQFHSEPDLVAKDTVQMDLPGDLDGPPTCPFTGPVPDWVGIPGAGYSFLLQCEPRDVLLDFIDPAILRMRHMQPGQPDHSYAVVPQPFADLPMEFGGDDGSLVVCAGHFMLRVDQPGCRFTITDDQGNPLLDDPPGGAYTEGSEQQGDELVQTRVLTRNTPSGERFYGFGEKTGPINKRGRKFSFWNSDNPSYSTDQDPLYQSIPFFIGFRDGLAYGIFTDNSYRMTMDMAASLPTQYSIKTSGGEMNQYIIAGPSLPQVLERYTRLTGRQTMPPRWTLGYHQCRWSYYPDSQVLDVCQQFRNRSIPADGIWLDIDYMDGFRSWTWDPVGFPDPANLVDQVEALGFKMTAIIDPGLKLDTQWEIYQSGVAGNHFISNEDGTPYIGVVWPGPSVFPDFTDPDTRTWWGTLIPGLADAGVKGIWLDMNEPASFVAADNWTLPDSLAVAFDGLGATMAQAHNIYALMENKATWEGWLKTVVNTRPFLLTRAGYAGIQRYAAVWTGDAASNFDSLADQVPMLMGLGLSGVAMVGSDVGGWEGNPGPELFARWLQLGSISPFFRTHVQTGTPDQEPWSYTLEVEEISRIAISQRYRLLPYFYSLLAESTLTGAPLLRPLVWEFPDDPQTWDLSYQAMLGPWLLYAPVLEPGKNEAEVYLPEGRWMEFHSAALYEGPDTVITNLKLQALPVYLREGAIVPMAQLMMYSDESPVDPLTLELFPGEKPTSFTLYEDDGVSLNHQQGASSSIVYTIQKTPGGARLTASPRTGSLVPPPRRLVLRLRPVDSDAAAVTLSGELLPQLDGQETFAQAPQGWHHDANDRSLWVTFNDHDNFQVEFHYNPAVSASIPDVLVPMQVEVPPGTPTGSPIHIATSAAGWAQQPLQWSDDFSFAFGQVAVARGQWFEYKYTRGGWDTVEKWSGCVEAENRYHFGKALPVKKDSVVIWSDQCE